MRVCYVPLTFSGSGFYRLLLPLRELQRLGHVVVRPAYRESRAEDGSQLLVFDLSRMPAADVYVFQMPLDAFVAGRVIPVLRRAGRVVVCEADDSDLYLPVWHPSFEATSRLADPRRNRDHRARAFRIADGVSVSTPALADEWGRLNGTVEVLPNFVPWELWGEAEPQYEVRRRRLRVGWMGRSFWRRGDLEVLRPVIRPFLEAHPDVDFVAAGDPGVHDLLGVPEGQRVSYQPAGYSKALRDMTASMDVGLVPLAPILFNECKSALKGMEYAACGIPCVASSTGPYREWVDVGENGFLASTPGEWRDALERLVADDDLRRRMGRAARAKAQAHALEGKGHLWESFYGRLLERRRSHAEASAGGRSRNGASSPAWSTS